MNPITLARTVATDDEQGGLAHPRCVAEFDTHRAAQAAVNRLVGAEFPVHEVALVGQGLRSVERVTGANRQAAAVTGAAFGAWFGLFGAAGFAFTTATNRLGYVLTSVLFGALAGLLWAHFEHAVLHRDYKSVTQLRADRYQLLVEHRNCERARKLLDRHCVVGEENTHNHWLRASG